MKHLQKLTLAWAAINLEMLIYGDLLKLQKKMFSLFLLCKLEDLSWLSGVEVPFLFNPKVAKGKFHMEPPESINLVGSYPLGTCIKPQVSVDLAVTIPAVS